MNSGMTNTIFGITINSVQRKNCRGKRWWNSMLEPTTHCTSTFVHTEGLLLKSQMSRTKKMSFSNSQPISNTCKWGVPTIITRLRLANQKASTEKELSVWWWACVWNNKWRVLWLSKMNGYFYWEKRNKQLTEENPIWQEVIVKKLEKKTFIYHLSNSMTSLKRNIKQDTRYRYEVAAGDVKLYVREWAVWVHS